MAEADEWEGAELSDGVSVVLRKRFLMCANNGSLKECRAISPEGGPSPPDAPNYPQPVLHGPRTNGGIEASTQKNIPP